MMVLDEQSGDYQSHWIHNLGNKTKTNKQTKIAWQSIQYLWRYLSLADNTTASLPKDNILITEHNVNTFYMDYLFSKAVRFVQIALELSQH